MAETRLGAAIMGFVLGVAVAGWGGGFVGAVLLCAMCWYVELGADAQEPESGGQDDGSRL